jgi:hypothetical protein
LAQELSEHRQQKPGYTKRTTEVFDSATHKFNARAPSNMTETIGHQPGLGSFVSQFDPFTQ